MEKEPDKLLSVKGIAQKKLKAIIKSYGETKALSDLMIYLAPFGVSMKKVAMIREEFGDNSLRIVKTDPFQLCKIKGFGFMTVDSVARKTKVSLKHPLRYSGAINYVLDEARVSGHLFLSVDETVGQCYELLNMGCDDEVVSEEEIRQAISNERVESRIYVEGSRVYLSYERMCEVKSAKRIVSMILQEGFTKIDDLDSKIDNAERTLHQKLAPSQRNAVKLCLSHPISIMTGGPGSGKTTTLRFILDIYKAAFPANEVLLAAPTGRASRRMAEQTGMYASTLHSALGLVTDEDSPLNDKELLSADLVVVDEFSMVDMRLAYTEGVMKSDLAYSFAQGSPYECGFVGLTGIPSYSQYERALEELDSIGVKRINVMVDSDYQVKEEVRKARDRYIEMGAAAGFEMAPITWTQKQKGVDDLYKHLFRDK